MSCIAWMAMMTVACNERPGKVLAASVSRIDSIEARLNQHVKASRLFNAGHGFSEVFCLLVDYARPSGDNRLIVFNLKRDSVEMIGKVAHGRCNEEWLAHARYSNALSSGCSSLGKYRIGAKYNGRFGLAYKLHGLDSTNSNAYKRTIVLHAHECVPDENNPVAAICQSDGCVMVAPALLERLKSRFSATSKPVLLWLYNAN